MMTNRAHTNLFRRTRHGGFSLLELLIVVSVLAILIALVAGAGSRVIRGQRVNVTENVLKTLDRALEEYVAATGGIPVFPLDPDNATSLERLYADVPGLASVAKGTDFEQFLDPYSGAISIEYPMRPDAAVFFRQAEGFDTVRAILEAIPERFLLTTLSPGAPPTGQDEIDKEQPSVVDSWGEATWNGSIPVLGVQQFIYYVHPRNRLAQDLYGKCVSGRPYFMSAGPDKFYGHPSELPLLQQAFPEIDPMELELLLSAARADNIYSYDVNPEFTISSQVLSGF